VISRIQNGLVHAAFSRWRAEAVRSRRIHLVCTSIVLRLQNQQLAAALTAWRLAVRQWQFDRDHVTAEAHAERQRTGEANAGATESARAALRIAEARAATLENELVESNRKARHAHLQYEKVSARLVEADQSIDVATKLREQLSSVEIRAEELETVQAANKELCVQSSIFAASVARFEDFVNLTKIGLN
jgi:signal recognition particle GTPase